MNGESGARHNLLIKISWCGPSKCFIPLEDEDGERGRNRTYNLLIKSQLLCQLSYAPVLG